MKNMLSKIHNNTTNRALSLILAIGLFTTLTDGSPFSRIISFGDSLADTGNAYAATGGALPPEPYYWQGRFSNGPVWVEYLAEHLELPIHDYAFGGAYTDDRNLNEFNPAFGGINLPGLADEISWFQYYASVEGVSNKDLFTLVVGANDYFGFLNQYSGDPYPGGIDNTVAAVEVMLQAGARHLVVMLVPDFSVTPAFSSLPDPTKAWISWHVSTYNAELTAALEVLVGEYKCNLVFVDLFSILNEIVANPGEYGLNNVVIPAQQAALYNVARTNPFIGTPSIRPRPVTGSWRRPPLRPCWKCWFPEKRSASTRTCPAGSIPDLATGLLSVPRPAPAEGNNKGPAARQALFVHH